MFVVILAVLASIFVVYIAYHGLAIHQVLVAHDKHVDVVIRRLQRRKCDKTPSWISTTYDEEVTQEQFDSNMRYFERNRNPHCGFYPDENALDKFAESCTFLGGPRAALLQVAHPMLGCIYMYCIFCFPTSLVFLTQYRHFGQEALLYNSTLATTAISDICASFRMRFEFIVNHSDNDLNSIVRTLPMILISLIHLCESMQSRSSVHADTKSNPNEIKENTAISTQKE